MYYKEFINKTNRPNMMMTLMAQVYCQSLHKDKGTSHFVREAPLHSIIITFKYVAGEATEGRTSFL